MDYNEWSMDYLNEAEKLREYLTPLRREARLADNETAAKLYRRIALLNDMYLDCLHIGRHLAQSEAKI